MLTTKKGAGAFRIFHLVCCGALLLIGCADPGPKALLEGERLIQENKAGEAIAPLQEAVELLPLNAQAWNYLGLAYHYSGQPSKAVENYQKALQIDRDLAAARYNLGMLFFEQGRYAAAASNLTISVTLQPKNGDAWNKLATAQLKSAEQFSGRERNMWLDAARRNFEIALQFEQDPHAYNCIGLIDVQRGRARDSVRNFNLALQKQPNYAPAILNLAVVYHTQLNDKRVALQRYREFLAHQPRSSRFREIEAVALQIERELNPQQIIPQANTINNQATPVAPVVQRPPAQVTVVQPAPRESKPEIRSEPVAKPAPRKPEPPTVTPRVQQQPVEVISPAPEEAPARIARDPETVTPAPEVKTPVEVARQAPPAEVSAEDTDEKNSRLGFVQRLNPATWFRGKTNETPVKSSTTPPAPSANPVTPTASTKLTTLPPRVEFPRYRYISPAAPRPGNRPEATRLFNEAVQAQRQREPLTALDLYRRATKADPSFFEAHYNLGLVAIERNLLNEALASYEMALAISPDSTNARYNFAFALQKGNYLPDATREFEKLLARDPRQTRIHLSLANLYAQQPAARHKARQHYQRVLELEPNHPQAAAIHNWIRGKPITP